MPGSSALQVTPGTGKAHLFFSQAFENSGLNSIPLRSEAARQPARPALAGPSRAASPAGRNAAAAWRGRYQDWLDADVLPRTSTDLFPRLPFGDAVKLAAMVGTGRMTWQDVNAALDGMIKLAAADALHHRSDEYHTSQAPQSAEQIAEDEIWARYHAQCDEVFAKDLNPKLADQRSPQELWRTERLLDRLRSARDRDLAAARRRFGAAESRSNPVLRRAPVQPAMRKLQPTPAERAALHKLQATGFSASADMNAAIDQLAGEVAEAVAAA